MVGYNPEGIIDSAVRLGHIFVSGGITNGLNYGREQIGIVVALFFLQHRSDSFQARTGVNIFGT
ncbi:hypothetical protein ES703_103511 [subsurface metagenome]